MPQIISNHVCEWWMGLRSHHTNLFGVPMAWHIWVKFASKDRGGGGNWLYLYIVKIGKFTRVLCLSLPVWGIHLCVCNQWINFKYSVIGKCVLIALSILVHFPHAIYQCFLLHHQFRQVPHKLHRCLAILLQAIIKLSIIINCQILFVRC